MQKGNTLHDHIIPDSFLFALLGFGRPSLGRAVNIGTVASLDVVAAELLVLSTIIREVGDVWPSILGFCNTGESKHE